MSFFQTAAVLGALAVSVSAHGHVTGVVSNGEWHAGTTPEWTYQQSKPNTAGWYANNQDNGFVDPASFADGDIVCHKGATPGLASIPVTAGESIDIQWNTWPESHHGPVLDYLAPVDGDFADIDKTALQFFKIDEGGLIDGSTAPGNWASDDLIANNNTWSVTIPASIAPGKYVLRHEIIALHSAGDANGAQNYPQCLNIEVTSTGTETPAGEPATSFYTAEDAGIKVGIYNAPLSYTIPGPALYGGGGSGGSTPPKPSGTTPSSSTTQPPYSNTTSIALSSSAPSATATSAPADEEEEPYTSAPVTATATATSAPASTTTTTTSSSSAYYASVTAAPSATSSPSAPPANGGGYSGGGNDSSSGKPSKDLPEGWTLADLQQWVAYLLKQGWSATSRNHARDFSV